MRKNKIASALFCALFAVGMSCCASSVALGEGLVTYFVNITPSEISLNSANQSENNNSTKEQVINAYIRCSEEISDYDINVYIRHIKANETGELIEVEDYATKVSGLRRNFDTYGNYYLDAVFDKSEVVNCANDNFVDGEAEIVLRGDLTNGDSIIAFEGSDDVYFR